MVVLNFLSVRYYGEAEVITANIKVLTFVGYVYLHCELSFLTESAFADSLSWVLFLILGVECVSESHDDDPCQTC